MTSDDPDDDPTCVACGSRSSWVAWDTTQGSWRCGNCVGLPLAEAVRKAAEFRARWDAWWDAW